MEFKPRVRAMLFDLLLLGFVIIFTVAMMILTYKSPSRYMFVSSSIVLLSISGYIYYLTYAIRKMVYILDDQGLRICYGFKEIILPYNEILSLEERPKINWSRLVGGEWPGNYTGVFKDKDSEQFLSAYASSKENVIIIRSLQGQFAITPADTNKFVNFFNRHWDKKYAKGEYLPEEFRLVDSTMGKVLILLNLATILGLAILMFARIRFLPESIPLQYNFSGEVARYGSPLQLYWLLLGPVIIFPVMAYLGNKLTTSGMKNGVNYLFTSLILTFLMALVILGMIL